MNGGGGGARAARAGESGGKKAAEEGKKDKSVEKAGRRVARRVVGWKMDALNRLEIFASQASHRVVRENMDGRGGREREVYGGGRLNPTSLISGIESPQPCFRNCRGKS